MDENEWYRACNYGDCPEILRSGDVVFFRNSRMPDDAVGFTAAEWRQFVADVKAGKFDEEVTGG